MVQTPVRDDLSMVTWCSILLEVASEDGPARWGGDGDGQQQSSRRLQQLNRTQLLLAGPHWTLDLTPCVLLLLEPIFLKLPPVGCSPLVGWDQRLFELLKGLNSLVFAGWLPFHHLNQSVTLLRPDLHPHTILVLSRLSGPRVQAETSPAAAV